MVSSRWEKGVLVLFLLLLPPLVSCFDSEKDFQDLVSTTTQEKKKKNNNNNSDEQQDYSFNVDFRPWLARHGSAAGGGGAAAAAACATQMNSSKILVSSPTVDVEYHMGPVLTSAIEVYMIWYGRWDIAQQGIIKDFVESISATGNNKPSVQQWWTTVELYGDQTGANISASVHIAGEHQDNYSQGKSLTRLSIQQVIKSSLLENHGTLPVNAKGGVYMVFTADDVMMQDFCRAVCGFHYFTFPALVGYTLPYAWVGNSGQLCPQTCAYPFAVPTFMTSVLPLKSPNDNIGVDGMVSVIGHELAEIASNPLINAWYAGQNSIAPNEIADLCEGIYGPGAGGSYPGSILQDSAGASYNVNGVNGRHFLVQWLWNPSLKACSGSSTTK
jgi:hypothetical protein